MIISEQTLKSYLMPHDKEKGIIRPTLEPIEILQQGKNHFFAIGINTYEHFLPLSNARKDIEDIAHVLVEKYYFEKQNMRLIQDDEATRENIIDELDSLRSVVKEDDRLLIYYSGHGFMDGERGFWIPVNAKRDRVSTYISNADVRDIIKSIKARHILLISDSCFSASLLVRDATREIGGAFMDWERNPSRWVFISGKGVVSDGKAGENSPFAASILKQLKQNDADALNVVRLADHVTQEIRFNYEQQAELSPLFQVGHSGGQFVFVKRQTEKDDWSTALKKNTEGGYLAYLKKYPDGYFTSEAEEKLEEIADEKEWTKANDTDAAFAYRQYLKKYPQGNHAIQAKEKLDSIEEVERLEREVERKEQERLAKIESDRKEQERLAKIEADRREQERIAKIEAERKEQERLAKLEADRKEQERLAKLEADRKEQERLTKLEADRKEQERLAKLEADKKELKRLAKIEAKKDQERLAKIEADRKYQEHLIKLKADREESERLAKELIRKEQERFWTKLEADKIEQERLSKIEADRKEQERLAKIEADRKERDKPIILQESEKVEKISAFQKYRAPIIGGSLVAASLLVWQLSKPNNDSVTPPSVQEPKQENPIVDNSVKQPQNDPLIVTQPTGATKIPKDKLPPNITVQKPADKPITQPTKPTTDPKAEANKRAEQERLAKIEADRKEKERLAKIEADKIAAQKYLKTALANIGGEEYSDAKSALSNAYKLSTLSATAKNYIKTALANIGGEEYNDAKKAINAAMNAL